MKKFERKDKNEKRRVLLYKNNELSRAFDNEKLLHDTEAVQENGVGVMAKVGALTKKQLRALIAILVAVCVLISGMIGIGFHVFANETPGQSKIQVDGLETSKSVVRDEINPELFHVKLEANNSLEYYNLPTHDIILVLDTSKRMNDVLFSRQYDNLNTHTTFKEYKFNTMYIDDGLTVTYNDLYDADNPHNVLGITDGLTSDCIDNKYVEDPNTPGVYVYVACKYKGPLASQTYILYFTDSMGNEYESDPHNGTGMGLTSAQPFIFRLKKNVSGRTDLKEDYECNSIWKRSDDSAKCSTLVANLSGKDEDVSQRQVETSHGSYLTRPTNITETRKTYTYLEPLYIKDDAGTFIPVYVTVEEYTREEVFSRTGLQVPGDVGGPERNYTQNTKYTFSTADGKYTSVLANSQYGADNSVFQGFKKYKYETVPNSTPPKKTLVVDHSNSLESKTLYQKLPGEETIPVSRLDATKEAVENFLIKVHRDAYERHSDVRVGVVVFNKANHRGEQHTYLMYSLEDGSDMANEVKVNRMIDNIYHIESERTEVPAQIDLGLKAAYNEFDAHSPVENKRSCVVLSAGVPSYDRYLWVGGSENDYNTSVATNAVSTAYNMKNNQGVNMYTVGMFDDANWQETYGKYFYYTGTGLIIKHQTQECSGTIGSVWGASTNASWLGRALSPADSAATNRLMNYISSDFMDAKTIGITKGTYNPGHYLSFGGPGYMITRNYYRTDNSQAEEEHYFSVPTTQIDEDGETHAVSDEIISQKLENAFLKIADSVKTAGNRIGTGATLKDTITDYFKIVERSDGKYVDAYTMSLVDREHPEDAANWARDADGTEPLTINPTQVSENTKSIEVKGFDYSKYNLTGWYTDDDGQNAQSTPKKLVVEFDITRTNDFLGGNTVPTNTADSGIYDEETRIEQTFDVPYKDISLKETGITQNQSIYYACEADLGELLDIQKVDGTNNAFVNIEYTVIVDPEDPSKNVTFSIPAGESPSPYTTPEHFAERYPQLDITTKYTVNVRMTPTDPNGAVRGKDLDPLYSTVYVYQPHIDVYNDAVYGSESSYRLDNVPEWSWRVHDENGTALTGNTLEKADALLNGKIAPNYSYDIAPSASPTSPVVTVNVVRNENTEDEEHYGEYSTSLTPADYDGTPVNVRTDFIVNNVNVKPTSYEYEFEAVSAITYYKVTNPGQDNEAVSFLVRHDKVENKYYDEEGAEMTASAAQSKINQANQQEEEIGVFSQKVDPAVVNASSKPEKHKVTFLNTLANVPSADRTETMWADPENAGGIVRDTGEFTIKAGIPYKLHIVKKFKGPMANPESIKFTVTDSSGNSQDITISNYNRLTGEATKDLDLFSDVNYIISEKRPDGTALDSTQYSAVGEKALNETVIGDLDANAATTDDPFDFTFKVTNSQLSALEESQRVLTITIENTDSTPIPAATGISEDKNSSGMVLIALVGTVVISSGAGVAYVYRRKGYAIDQ